MCVHKRVCMQNVKITTGSSCCFKPVLFSFILIYFLSHQCHVKRKCILSMLCVIIESCGFRVEINKRQGERVVAYVSHLYDMRDVDRERMRQETDSLY